MYLPEQNAETRTEVLQSLIQSHPLGAWVALGDGELVANHIPFAIDTSRGPLGTLVGHVARANPIWRQLHSAVPALVIFQGPQAYVTPSWYPSKHEHGKAVPTWNYVVVHASGIPNFVHDAAWLHDHVSSLTHRHESAQAVPWAVADAPADYIDKMVRAIVGVEIPIDGLIGKWKMSQNRSGRDQMGVAAGLLASGEPEAARVASIIERNLAKS